MRLPGARQLLRGSQALSFVLYAAVAEAESRDAFAGHSARRVTPMTTSKAEPPQYLVRSLT